MVFGDQVRFRRKIIGRTRVRTGVTGIFQSLRLSSVVRRSSKSSVMTTTLYNPAQFSSYPWEVYHQKRLVDSSVR